MNLIPITLGAPHTSPYSHDQTKVTITHHKAPQANSEVFSNILSLRGKSDGYTPELKDLAGSNLPVGNMDTKVEVGETESFHSTIWARNSEFGSVASNQDRSTPNVQMLRVWKSQEKATSFLGRADTEYRLKQQVQFMLEHDRRGLAKDLQGNYSYTYFVNSLTKHGEIKDLSHLDERESLIQEHQLLSKENNFEFDLDGDKVLIKLIPIHIHQNISGAGETLSHLFNDNLNGKSLEKKINSKGYSALFAKIPPKGDLEFLNTLKSKLEEKNLSVRQRFIFTDLLQRLINLPTVYHCKSSVDRGGVAAAIGATNEYFLAHLNSQNFETIINSDEYKEMFFAQVCRAHQETLAARFGMNENKTLTGKQKLGLKMYGSVLTDSLPNDMVKETLWEKSKGLRVLVSAIATIAYILFYPVIMAFMFSVGHLLLGAFQLGILAKKGKSIANRLTAFHALPYALTPWNIHKAAHKHINYSNEQMKTYRILA